MDHRSLNLDRPLTLVATGARRELDGSDRNASLVEVAAARLASDVRRLWATRIRTLPFPRARLGRWVVIAVLPLVGITGFLLGTHSRPNPNLVEPNPAVASIPPLRQPARSVSAPPAYRRPALADVDASLPKVVGIVGRLPGDAVVLVKDDRATLMVAVGSAFAGWRLVELSSTEAVFLRDGIRRTVELPATD